MTGEVEYREANAADAAMVAALHADSWRRHYRHSYPDTFFGDALDEDRLAVWTERLGATNGTHTVVAEAPNGLVGFVHVALDGDPTWGALVDNLHVRHDLQRHGVASQLMKRAASFVTNAAPGSGLYLWVLERNVGAQAFYRSIGGRDADRRPVDPPALPDALCIRYVWREPRTLAEQTDTVVDEVLRVVERGEVDSLVVDDLTLDDLNSIAWSGSALHIKSVEENLRRPAWAVEYLCVRSPSGGPVAKGGIDYEAHAGAGTLWQFAVHPSLQGLGLGTHLVGAAESRIRRRGLGTARIGVDDGNDDALRLYLRLGYERCGRWSSSWPALDENGAEYLHEAEGTELEKPL